MEGRINFLQHSYTAPFIFDTIRVTPRFEQGCMAVFTTSRFYRIAVPLFILSLYIALSLPYLDRAPVVHQDEPWIASTSWKLATTGIYGSDMFTGYYRMEERYYLNLPLYALLTAPLYRLIGIGLFQARWGTLALGAVVLTLTYVCGRRWFGTTTGILAMVLMLSIGITEASPYHLSRLFFFDAVRVARYDILVAVFGLCGLWCVTNAYRKQYRVEQWYTLAGLCFACATLSNLYGVFWMGVVVLFLLWQRAPWRVYGALGIGFGLPMITIALYILDDTTAFLGQMQTHAPRFGIGDIRWYLTNVHQEVQRYTSGANTGRSMTGAILSTVIGFLIGIVGLSRRAVRGDAIARLLVIAALGFPLAFALFITIKKPEYGLTIFPIWTLIIARGFITLWQIIYRYRAGVLVRVAIVLAVGLIMTESSLQLYRFYQTAPTITPYITFSTRLHQDIPPQVRVLGLQNYWFSFTDVDYRTWYVPMALAGSDHTRFVRTLPDSLDLFNPDYIVIDPIMRSYFAEAGTAAQHAAELNAWMTAHHFHIADSFTDATYGMFEIYAK